MGLMFHAVFKVPMQAFILFTGVMVCMFYQFVEPPLLFKQSAMAVVEASPRGPELAALKARYSEVFQEKRTAVRTLAAAAGGHDDTATAQAQARVKGLEAEAERVRSEAKNLVRQVDPGMDVKDSDYVFLTFIVQHLPRGLVGLLLAVIFCAAMSASSSELNALGSTTTVDIYKRLVRPGASEGHYVVASRTITALWGGVVVGFALFAHLLENLIEAVNILGSLFYGTILGIFLTAFLLARVSGTAVFAAALAAEALVILLYLTTDIGYLWYNVIGCALVLLLSLVIQPLLRSHIPSSARRN
jgi:hypothetical protein